MAALSVPVLTVVAAYLIGAIPFGYLVARGRGVNLFEHGSGNIGATNVGRVLGRRLGLAVFILDFAKGAVPALVASWLRVGTAMGGEDLGVAAGLAALLGHLFPIYLRFRGGKGVATGAGVVAVLLPGPALGALFTWVALVAATRYVSLASLGAAVALCGFRLMLTPQPLEPGRRILTSFCLVAMALVFLRHRANLTRLLAGTENRLTDTPTMLLFTKILHVLALGLCFGTTVFFTFVVGLSLFGTFESLSARPGPERPLWFPLPAEYDRARPSDRFPEPLRKDQGSRAFGAAVGPLFDWYFGIQAVCGVLALATAGGWMGLPGGVHKARVIILLLAVLSVAGNWLLERRVGELQRARNDATDAVLRSAQPSSESVQAADGARQTFGTWHFYSLMANFVTVLLVSVAMGMAALLPSAAQGQPAAPTDRELKVSSRPPTSQPAPDR
jgi:acyl-phosphate glycerol 3-phosphate acyltransferase